MKFLCDNCKAKYQIADEKVAGKTVRMKCRKCGHQIEVRAEVTESSVSAAPPRVSEAPRAPQRSSLATSLSSARPRGSQTPPPGGALAGAFQRTVQEGSGAPPSDDVEISVTEEWYVAINGVPVGPVRISELRRKAASGAVTEDSLCWQEGLEEWRPVRSVPELAAIVREAAQSNRASLVSPPSDQRTSTIPKPPPPPARPSGPRASELPPKPALPPRSNVVPLHARAPERVDETAPLIPPMIGAAALAAPAPGMTPRPAMLPTPPPAAFADPEPSAPAAAAVAVADPFAVPAAAPVQAQAIPSAASLFPPPPSALAPAPAAKRGAPPAWFLMLAGVTVGVIGAAILFSKLGSTPQTQVVVAPPPTTAAPTETAAPSATVAEPTPTVTASAAPTTPTKVATGGPGRTTTTAATAKQGGGGGGAADLSSLGLSTGGSGPNVGPGGAGGSGGGGLDQAGVERVVASHRIGVRRTCWERGGADQKSSVNVTINATVGPNGDVVSTSSSGDDPAVGKCIENQVRTWKFPAPGQSTPIAIPFKFVRQ